MTERVKTFELKKVTAAIRPFYFQLSHYFLKVLNQGRKPFQLVKIHLI